MHILNVEGQLTEEVVIEKTDHLARSAVNRINGVEFRPSCFISRAPLCCISFIYKQKLSSACLRTIEDPEQSPTSTRFINRPKIVETVFYMLFFPSMAANRCLFT